MKTVNFWQNLKPPFSVLAPMDGITDFTFRQNIVKIGRPDVFFTEFTSVEGLQSRGEKTLHKNLSFGNNEQPVVAQIWGIEPENFYKSAKTIKNLNFSGVDINMGCPDKTVVKSGACSALINNKKRAYEIIQAVKDGASGLPVSVKTRIGFSDTREMEDWLGFLLEQKIDALSVHLRTVRELSKTEAHWELMGKIVNLRDKMAKNTIIIGNGDIKSLLEINSKYTEFGCEGFMIGRGALHNPWIFSRSRSIADISIKEKLETYMAHIELFEKFWGAGKNFAGLKKFCKAYINNFEDASGLREEIMQAESLGDLKARVRDIVTRI